MSAGIKHAPNADGMHQIGVINEIRENNTLLCSLSSLNVNEFSVA